MKIKMNKNKPDTSQDKESLSRLEKVLQLMSKHSVSELEWETKDEKLKVRSHKSFDERSLTATPVFSVPQSVSPTASTQQVEPAVVVSQEKTPLSDNQRQVISPLVGTFYRAASPEAQPYAQEGQSVKKGDVLCIIEAMKLMNEIDSEWSGKIISVLVENGQPVEFGEPLFIIELTS